MTEHATTVEPTRDSVVSLREITRDNCYTIMRLRTTKEQENFVAPNDRSLAEALFHPQHAWYRAIYADETPVGFAMMYDNPDDPRGPEYYLWRFMIDQRYQRMGFGKQALDLLVAHVRTRPNATNMTLSYVPEEGGPAEFYHRFGFVDTGDVDDDELVSRLILEGVDYAPVEATVSLQALGKENLRDVLRLRVESYQQRYVATVAEMIGEAYLNPGAYWVRVVCANDRPVGLLLLQESGSSPREYLLAQMMIDEHYQQNGFGRKAIALLADHVRSLADGQALAVTSLRGKDGPEEFFRKCGFVETAASEEDRFAAVLDLRG